MELKFNRSWDIERLLPNKEFALADTDLMVFDSEKLDIALVSTRSEVMCLTGIHN